MKKLLLVFITLLASSQQAHCETYEEREQAKAEKALQTFQAHVEKEAQEYQERMKSFPADFTAACLVFEEYKDNGDGTLTDPRNELIWQKCALGQTWDGSSCSGNASKLDWFAAMLAAKSDKFSGLTDWRLPTSAELKSVMRSESDCKKVLQFEDQQTERYIDTLNGFITNDFIYSDPNGAEERRKFKPYSHAASLKLKERKKIIELKNVSAKLSFNIGDGSMGLFWSITPFGDIGYTPIAGYCGGGSVIGNFNGGSMASSYRSGYGDCSTYGLFNVRLVRAGQLLEGEGIPEFEREYQRIAKAQEEIRNIGKQKLANESAQKEAEKKQQTEQQKQRREYEAKAITFRKNLQPGDKAIQGLVLAVNGKLIKVQVTDTECSQRFSNNACAGYSTVLLEKWFQRSELLPR